MRAQVKSALYLKIAIKECLEFSQAATCRANSVNRDDSPRIAIKFIFILFKRLKGVHKLVAGDSAGDMQQVHLCAIATSVTCKLLLNKIPARTD